MFAEPTHTPRAAREKAVAALFEGLRCPALFLAKAAVLSAFALGRQTALVVDAGHGGTTGGRAGHGVVSGEGVRRVRWRWLWAGAARGGVSIRAVQWGRGRPPSSTGWQHAARHVARCWCAGLP